jgi:small conductance mechanosensitive channel
VKTGIENFYTVAYHWVLNYAPKIIAAIIVFFIGQWIIRLLRKWITKFFLEARFKQVRPFFQGLIAIGLQILLVLMIMQILGIKMTIFAAVITAFGVAAGFALSGTLQNFASGVLILILRPYKIGDNIITQGQEGTVSSIQLFYTVVTSFDNKTIIVPNSKLSNEIIINLSRKGNRRIDIEFKFNFGVDIDNVRSIINEAVLSSKSLLITPTHRVVVSTVEPDGYRLSVNVWVAAHGYLDAKYALQEKIINELKQKGIKLPGM